MDRGELPAHAEGHEPLTPIDSHRLVFGLARMLLDRLERLFHGSRTRSPTDIDPGIAALVSAMNQSGVISTIASCEGHPRKLYSPYVYFSSSVDVASQVEDALRKAQWDGCRRKPGLAVDWVISGHFNDSCQLKFSICAPEYDLYSRSQIRAWLAFGIRRKVVQKDLRLLAELLTNMAFDPREYDIYNNRR